MAHDPWIIVALESILANNRDLTNLRITHKWEEKKVLKGEQRAPQRVPQGAPQGPPTEAQGLRALPVAPSLLTVPCCTPSWFQISLSCDVDVT